MYNKNLIKKELCELLVKHTGCRVQEAKDGQLRPCGTCTCDLLGSLMDEEAPEYKEHNDDFDRVNEVWRAILQIRDC